MTSRGQQLLVPAKGKNGPVLPVTAGLVAWYSADAISGVAGGSPVASWLDSSGGGNTASQATQSKQPTLTAVWRNGRAAVLFDGVDDFITSTFAVNQPNTWVAVGQFVATAGFLIDGVDASNRQVIGMKAVGGALQFFAGTGPTAVSNMDLNPFIIIGNANGLSSNLYQNGAQIINADIGTGHTAGLTLGAAQTHTTNFYSGRIAQILCYNRSLSSAERIALDHYFSTYYSITVAD